MRVLFVNNHAGSQTLPLSSACLASALEEQFPQDVDCPILELAPGFSQEEALKRILDWKPQLVAFTIYSWSRHALLELASKLAILPNTPLMVAGGPEVTAAPHSIPLETGIDVLVAGEGEKALGRIIQMLLDAPQEGHQHLLRDLPRPLMEAPEKNLDLFPSPYHARHMKLHYPDAVWELARGCPFSCHFCFESKGDGSVRCKSYDRAREELSILANSGARDVFVLDPTFNAQPKRAKELLRLFAQEAPHLRYHIEVRAEFLDEEQAALCSELECSIQIGLQTAHAQVARNIGRPFNPERFREQLIPLQEYGIPFGLDLIYGLPGDTLDGFRESLDFVLTLQPNHIDIFPLSVLPGTRLAETAQSLGLKHQKDAPYLIHGREGFSEAHLHEAEKLAQAADSLYNGARALPWFLSACALFELQPWELLTLWEHHSSRPTSPEEQHQILRHFLLLTGASQKAPIQLSHILADTALWFTVESAIREGASLPSQVEFHHNPNTLGEHLEMGIDDFEELAAFVPVQPGFYTPSLGPEGPFFQITEK